jgi:hypothetical protein
MPRTAAARRNVAAPNKEQADALKALQATVARQAEQLEQYRQENHQVLQRAETAERELLAASTTPGSPPPVILNRGIIESGDHLLAGDGDEPYMESVGKPRIVQRMIEVDGQPVIDAKWAERMQFMEEKVVVMVHEEGTAANAQHPESAISVWNGGQHQLFPRGVEVTCSRKFLEVLCRSRVATYGNVEYIDQNSGIRMQKYPKRVANKYPFSVIRDDNPRGRAWLSRLFQEA